MQNITKVEFVLENCESIEISSNCIGLIMLNDIHTTICRFAANSISKLVTSKNIFVEMYKEGDAQYHPFDTESKDDTKFSRLNRFHDITQIRLYYDDGSEECYFTDYDPDSDRHGEANRNQSSYLSSLGNLYISICKGKTIDDYIQISNAENAEFTSQQPHLTQRV